MTIVRLWSLSKSQYIPDMSQATSLITKHSMLKFLHVVITIRSLSKYLQVNYLQSNSQNRFLAMPWYKIMYIILDVGEKWPFCPKKQVLSIHISNTCFQILIPVQYSFHTFNTLFQSRTLLMWDHPNSMHPIHCCTAHTRWILSPIGQQHWIRLV